MRSASAPVGQHHRRVRSQLVAQLTEVDGGTILELRQEDLEPGAAPDTGPGWEWYLDRLVASIADDPPPTLADFETNYLPMGSAYTAMLA